MTNESTYDYPRALHMPAKAARQRVKFRWFHGQIDSSAA